MLSKKFAATLLLFVYLSCVQTREASAFAPAIIAAGAAGAALLVMGGYAVIKAPTVPTDWGGSSAARTSAGNMARIVMATYNNYTQYNQNVLWGDYCVIRVKIKDMQDWGLTQISLMQQEYSQLYDYLYTGASPPIGVDVVPAVGDTVVNPQTGQLNEVISVAFSQWYSRSSDADTVPDRSIVGGVLVAYGPLQPGGSYGFGAWAQYRCGLGPYDPSIVPKTLSAIEAWNPTGVIPGGVADDFDRLLTASGAAIGAQLVDATLPGQVDGADTLPPPAITTPPVSPTAPNVTDLAPANVQAQQTAANNAAQTSTTAQNTLQQYVVSHPDSTVDNDSTLADLTSAAQQAAQAAQTAAQAAQAAQVANDEVYNNPAADALKQFNFDPLKTLLGVMTTVFPFSLLTGVVHHFDNWVTTSPVPPYFRIPIPFGPDMEINLVPWDGVATVLRALIATLLTVGIILYIVRFYRGVS